MKTLLVTGIFPPDHGGPASYVPAIASALARRGHQVIGVVTMSDVVSAGDESYGYPLYRVPRGDALPIRALKVIRLLRRLSAQADVIYLNGLVLEGVVACKLLSRRFTVVKVVGDLIWERAQNQGAFAGTIEEFQTARLPLKWRMLRRLQCWYMQRVDRVICPSEYLARIVRGWGVDAPRVKIIYNSIELSSFEATVVAPPSDLVTVARLVPWKGVAELIRIAKKHNWSLRIVGDGPLRKQLQEYARTLDVTDRITFVGHVAQPEVAAQIRAGKVFVLNSSYEGLPHIVLEAQLAGVPVVATRAGGTVEVIEDGVTGRLAEVGDERTLAACIEELLHQPQLRERFAREGAQRVRAKHAFETMIAHLERVLGQQVS